jgi:predicted Zn-dependent protease
MAGSLRRLLRITNVLAAGVLLGSRSLMVAQPGDAADRWRRANELMQAGKPDQAIPLYRELAASSPRDPSIGINLAIAQYKAHHYRDAIEECESLVKLQPQLFSAWLFLGASQLELGDAASATVALKKAAGLSPGDRNARLMLADALLAQDRYAEAAGHFEELRQTMPDSPRIWYGLDRSYEGLAIEASDRLETAAPGSPETLALTGDFELERQQFARALQRYRQALAARPSFPGVRQSVSMIYEETGHPDWALVERQKEAQAAPDCVSQSLACQFIAGHFREIATASATTPGEIYWQAKAFLRLSQQAHERLQQLPASRERYEAGARVYQRRGRWPEAAAAWKEALRLSPGDTKIPQKLALALCRSNDCSAALPILKDAIIRDPSSAELNFLYGVALNGIQDPRGALPYLEAAVKLDGNLLEARAALGEAYLEAGEPERAIPQLEKAIAEDADGSRHYQLARAYQSAGKREQAGAILRAYREILGRRESTKEDDARITPP